MNVGSVQGGTHAGWRIVKPKPQGWLHTNCVATADGLRFLRGHWRRCPDCGTRRPR